MPSLLLMAGLLAAGQQAELKAEAEPSWGSLWASVQASSAAELDTNARRGVTGNLQSVLGGGSRPDEQVTDGLLRLILDLQSNLQIGKDHQIYGSYVLGAKRFFEQDTEDLLTHNLSLGSLHELSPHVRLGLSGWFKASRIRSQLRDYNLGIASAQLGFQLAKLLRLDVGGDLRTFRFYNESRFDYWGPRGFLRMTVSWPRTAAIFLRGGFASRSYRGNALVEGRSTIDPNAPPRLIFCDSAEFELRQGIECTPAGPRRDLEGQVEIGGRLRTGPLLLRGGYLLRLQRSNGDFENIDRHRLYAQITWALPFWELTSNVMATLQINNGVSVTDTKFLAEDDENQNSLRVQLRRPIAGGLDIEINYGLFANQFSTADVSFLRQTVSLGLRMALDGTQPL